MMQNLKVERLLLKLPNQDLHIKIKQLKVKQVQNISISEKRIFPNITRGIKFKEQNWKSNRGRIHLTAAESLPSSVQEYEYDYAIIHVSIKI